jgi:hypothetical protein
MTRWRTAAVVWVGSKTLDAALLAPRRGNTFRTGLQPTPLGFASGSVPVLARAIGFPAALDNGSQSDLLQVHGSVDPVTAARAGTPVFGVRTPAPKTGADWKGMSGAGVFAGDVLLGVVANVPGRLGDKTLRLSGTQGMFAAPAAAALLKKAGFAVDPRAITSEQAQAVPAEGSWERVRKTYAAAVLDQYGRLDYAALPGDIGSRPRTAIEGFQGQRFKDRTASVHRLVGIEELAREKRAVIVGAPGRGKSTALKQVLALAVRRDPLCVPLWIPIAALSLLTTLTRPALIKFAVERAQALGLNEVNEAFFERAAAENRLVIAFDGFDEAREVRRAQVRDLITDVADAWPDCPVWVSSRPGQYDATPLPMQGSAGRAPPFTVWEIAALEPEDIETFLRVCFADDGTLAASIESQDDLAAVRDSPQALSMIALIARGDGLPRNRAELFERWIDVVCRTSEEAKDQGASGAQASLADVGLRKRALQLIAWELQNRGDQASDFAWRRARLAATPLFPQEGPDGAERVVRWLVDRTGVLVRASDGETGEAPTLRFAHLQFQEFLAAVQFEHLWSQQRQAALSAAQGRWWRDDWFEMLRFASARLAEEAEELFAAILAQTDEAEPFTLRRTLLAAQLMASAPKVSSARVASVVHALETLLVGAPYLFNEVAAAITGLGRHDGSVEAVIKVASGQLLEELIRRERTAKELKGNVAAVLTRLPAIEAVAALLGKDRALTLMEDLPWPNPLEEIHEITVETAVLITRYRLRDEVDARNHLDALLRLNASLEQWEGIAEQFDSIGASAFVNSGIAGVLAERPDLVDLPRAAWAVRRGLTAVDTTTLERLLEKTLAIVRRSRTRLEHRDEVGREVGAALDLWAVRPLPQAHRVFEAVLQDDDLLWYWAYNIRERVPDLARQAVQAMLALAEDPSMTDDSRRNGMVYNLARDPDDALVVPVLLRLLAVRSVVLWRGEMVAQSLQARGHSAEALAILKDHVLKATPVSERAQAVAEDLQPGITDEWLPKQKRSRAHAQADDRKQERFASPSPRSSEPTQEQLEAELDAILDAPVNPAAGEVTDKLWSMMELGNHQQAIAAANRWMAPVNSNPVLAPLLASRLLFLARIDLWEPSWSSLLVRAVRAMPPMQREAWVPLMRQRL